MGPRLRRIAKWIGWSALVLAVLMLSGLLLADRLMPPASGRPSRTLPVRAAQTALDREVAPLLVARPGRTGMILLPNGLDAFAARALSARNAGRSLDLQYYLWHDDLTGRLLGREVFDAAARGVRVRMLLDDMTATGKDKALLALDAHPNIEVRVYNPFRNRAGLWRLVELAQRAFSVNHRMHNKAWIADGRVAVIGGRNIGEEYFSAAPEVNFRDLDVLLMGPAVAQAGTVFDAYWNSRAAIPITAFGEHDTGELQVLQARMAHDAEVERAQAYLDRVKDSPGVRDYLTKRLRPHWSANVEVVADPPLKWKRDDPAAWLVTRLSKTLASTRREALVISPYFVPGDAGTEALTDLVRRGAAVAVVTNSLAANDVFAVHSGYADYRERLLRGGVRLYEIRAQQSAQASLFGSSGASLHTKAFVVDDARGFVGSFNLDPRSVALNTEMGVLFDDPGAAAALGEEYRRLAAPEASYWVYLDRHGALRWLDRAQDPPRPLDTEPDTRWPQRAAVEVLRWLPIESQL